MAEPVLYVIACAAPPARDVGRLVAAAQAGGWTTCVLATPSAVRFMDVAWLAGLTGYPVRSEYKNPDEPDVLPPPDAIIVAPATVNTINKWAAGICDTLPLGILVESYGLRLAVVAVPWTSAAHAAHPVLAASLARLASWGVRVLPGATGADADVSDFPWEEALAAVAEPGPAGSPLR
jgi:phosphopantothenoylcysteine decarboxylase